MTYATFSDVLERYKPIRTLIGSEDLQVSTLSVSSVFINDAESYVDSILGRKYVVPLSVTPAYITQITADIAIFNILTDHLPQKPDFFQPRYDRAMAMLKDLVEGSMVISSATLVTTGDNEAWSTTQGYHSVFSPVVTSDLELQADVDRVETEVDLRRAEAGGTEC